MAMGREGELAESKNRYTQQMCQENDPR